MGITVNNYINVMWLCEFTPDLSSVGDEIQLTNESTANPAISYLNRNLGMYTIKYDTTSYLLTRLIPESIIWFGANSFSKPGNVHREICFKKYQKSCVNFLTVKYIWFPSWIKKKKIWKTVII